MPETTVGVGVWKAAIMFLLERILQVPDGKQAAVSKQHSSNVFARLGKIIIISPAIFVSKVCESEKSEVSVNRI